MSADTINQTADRQSILRQDLKAWEQTFTTAHDGRRAGREDIKRDPAIGMKSAVFSLQADEVVAAKYKEYSRLRAGPLLETSPGSPSRAPKRQKLNGHRSHEDGTQTPRRLATSMIHPAAIDPYDSPSAIQCVTRTPSRRTMIGPTPQKDGQILGLFDLLSDDELVGQTPSRGRIIQAQGTPRKDSPLRSSRTPASSGKRFLLDSFATPAKRQKSVTPSKTGSAWKMQFATPAFLRRDSQWGGERNDGVKSEEACVRMPAKPPLRGLSSMLASLRRMEDERMDDDMDVFHELEGEREIINEEAAVEGDGEDKEQEGKPSRVWKKKGQKRTTRRVIRESWPQLPRDVPTVDLCSPTSSSQSTVNQTRPSYQEGRREESR